jgi:hypothetical protein
MAREADGKAELEAMAPDSLRRRRGTDIHQLSAWEVFRRYLVISSWFGNAGFVVYGLYLGFSYGGFGGIKFFSSMFLLDRLGSLTSFVGAILGIVIGLICVWTLFIIFAACFAALAYWSVHRSIPSPPR